MQQLFEIQRIILEQFEKLPFYARSLFEKITLKVDDWVNGISSSLKD